MEKLIFQATQEGNTASLLGLLQEDPLVLDRVMANYSTETPLHVAAMLGHVDIVRELVNRKPQLTRELNSNKSSPLHLASTRGFIDVVRVLLSIDHEMCLVLDKDGRNPLHLAAMKGKVDVLQELLQAKPDAARATMYGGDTILHTCVMYNQFDVLKLIVNMMSDQSLLNAKNSNGNTILHMAVADKQTETINYLLYNTNIEENIVNLYELTAMDILIQSRRDVKDMDIRVSLNRAGVVSAKDYVEGMQVTTRTKKPKKNLNDFIKKQQDWLETKRNTLMIVASLIATMAFQVGVNPPGGFYQETKGQEQNSTEKYNAGDSILAHTNALGYSRLLILNTISFIASLSSILLLISGLPLRRKIFVWILMVVMWIAITAIALTYVAVIIMTTTEAGFKEKTIHHVIVSLLFSWMALMVLLLLGHSTRIVVKIVKAISKFIRRKKLEFINYRNVNILNV